MSMTQAAYIPEVAKTHGHISRIVVLALLLLRLPFLGGVAYFSNATPEWLSPAFEIATYLLTAFLIWWEKDRLATFHIDTLAVIIILLFKPIETLILASWGYDQMPLAFPKAPSLVLWVIAVGLALSLRLGRVNFPQIKIANFKWFAVGILTGVGLASLFAYPMSLQMGKSSLNARPEFFPLLVMCLVNFVYQLGYAAVTEEPLFRGFLWGHLREFGWREGWICLFQAGLFAIGHIYYVNKAPVSFWFIVPVSALVFGLLAWRSRSIATSMAAHATTNALGALFANIVSFYRL